MQQQGLTPKEQRLMRHWFRKTDSNTIELKEKRWGAIKIYLGLLLLVGIYYHFIDPRYKDNTWRDLEITFQPEKWIEKQYQREVSDTNPNLTKFGETKEEFLVSIKKYRKDRAGFTIGYTYVVTAIYVVFFIYCLWPTKRRVRFDRKRGIIYTYLDKKFYLTEVNKLMRPFPEYFAFVGGMMCFWVHPYQQAKHFANFRRGSQMIVSDYTMWLPMIFMIFPGAYQKSKGAVLKRFLVDFMNPNTPPERIASMMQALESRRTLREWLARIVFGWLDSGLYCRKLPKDAFLEQEIEKYFAEDAPNIKALPSFAMGTYEESLHLKLKFKNMRIISVEDNIECGFNKVPCPNLYEYPKVSLHYNRFGIAWGNEREDMSPSQQARRTQKKSKIQGKPKK